MSKINSRRRGFTLVEIMIAVAILSLLAAIVIPTYVRARTTSRASACIEQLRQIHEAMQEWALECRKGPQQPVQYMDIGPYLKHSVVCPAGGTSFSDSYNLTIVGEMPTCKIVPTGEHPHVFTDTGR